MLKVILSWQHHGYRDVVVLCSRGEWSWTMNRNEKPKVAWEWLNSVPSVCARFILARLEFDSESSVSRGNWDCSIPLPHRVKSGTFMIHNMVECKYIFYLVCVDRCLPRLVNPTRIWKLKFEIKDLLFVAFQQKKTLEPSQALHV